MAKNLNNDVKSPKKKYKVKGPFTFMIMAGSRVLKAFKAGEEVEATDLQVKGQLHKLIPLEDAPAPKESPAPEKEPEKAPTPETKTMESVVKNNDPKPAGMVVKKTSKARKNEV